MVAQLSKKQCGPFDSIHHAVFVSDSAGPEARQCMFQWFRFTKS